MPMTPGRAQLRETASGWHAGKPSGLTRARSTICFRPAARLPGEVYDAEPIMARLPSAAMRGWSRRRVHTPPRAPEARRGAYARSCSEPHARHQDRASGAAAVTDPAAQSEAAVLFDPRCEVDGSTDRSPDPHWFRSSRCYLRRPSRLRQIARADATAARKHA